VSLVSPQQCSTSKGVLVTTARTNEDSRSHGFDGNGCARAGDGSEVESTWGRARRKKKKEAKPWGLTPVTLATQEAQIRRIEV
jgi:hypothetical protein